MLTEATVTRSDLIKLNSATQFAQQQKKVL